jgi:hypothetical protein
MTVMQKVPDDHPMMKAWEAYKATQEFGNALKWATRAILVATEATLPEANRVDPADERERTARGALWSAFVAGFNAATRRAADLHEQINPASDAERRRRVPGAGAMGAVIEYRDRIRQPA